MRSGNPIERPTSARAAAAVRYCAALLVVSLSLGCNPRQETPAAGGSKAATAQEQASTPAEQHFEDFADAEGAWKDQRDGGPETVFGEPKNLIYTYAKVADDAGGRIRLAIHEDNVLKGHDGRPGVLRFEITEIGGSIDHFGAIYLGDADGTQIRIPAWEDGQVDEAALAGAFLEFRYRAENCVDPARAGATFNVRLEPELPDSWLSRIDFGPLHATSQWQTFVRSFAEGTNRAAFVRTLRERRPGRFKLVWGQEGPASNYQPGDSLLIDDIRISIAKPEAGL